MKKQFISLTACSIIAMLLFTACNKKTNTQGRYVPATAAAVMHINGESLNAKLPWSEIKNNEWFKEMIADTSMSAMAKATIDNPENSGIDIKKDILLFYINDTAGSYAAIEGAIANDTKFKQNITEIAKDAKETNKDGYTFLTNEKGCIAFNKEKFFATMATGSYGNVGNYTNATAMLDSTIGDVTVKSKTDMSAKAAQLIALAEDKSMAKNEKFSELVATKGDAHFWINAQYLVDTKSLGAMAAMANLSKLYEGAITAGTLSFDNGKIDADVKSYGGKEITDLYKKYNGTNVDKTMLQNIPSQNVAGVFAFNFKPEGLKEFLKLFNMDGWANLGTSQYGFNLDDFIKANKGDILIAATDLKTDTLTDTPKPKFIFATSIGEKKSFNKLIDAGKKLGAGFMGSGAENNFHFNTNDKYFAISDDKATTDKFLAGTTTVAPSYIDKIVGGPFGGYVNFQYILGTMKPKAGADSTSVAMYNASLKLWDNIMLNGGTFKDGGITQHWEVNMMDKTTNSLKQLNTYIGFMSAMDKKKTAAQDAKWKNEDVISPNVFSR